MSEPTEWVLSIPEGGLIAIDAVFRHFLNAQAVKLFISPQVRHHYGNLAHPKPVRATLTSPAQVRQHYGNLDAQSPQGLQRNLLPVGYVKSQL